MRSPSFASEQIPIRTAVTKIIAVVVAALGCTAESMPDQDSVGRASSALASGVKLVLTQPTVYPSSSTEVLVDIDPTSGFVFETLHFYIKEGLVGGEVSVSKDDLFNPAAPTIRLNAGTTNGTYLLRVVPAKDPKHLLDEVSFKVVDQWPATGDGPSLWLRETTPAPKGRAWGGGADIVQNSRVMPVSGIRNVCVFFALPEKWGKRIMLLS